MSRERGPRGVVARRGRGAAAAVGIALGAASGAALGAACGGDRRPAASADGASTVAVLPSPGFTSAQGTAAPADGGLPAPPTAGDSSAQAVADERASLASLPAGAGREVVVGSCLVCHSATMLVQQHKDTAGWNKTVTQMTAWGAPVPAAQHDAVVAYLALHYPMRSAAAAH